MELYRKDFEIWKNEIYLLPTIKVLKDNMMYCRSNFSIEFHFLVFHARLIFMRKKVE